jgi:aerobic carbon-monoxide dehydrogenase medium subunit
MIPAAFDYELAESVDHAIELLGREDAKLLAGGHSLLPLMKLRFSRPSLLVDIGRLTDLSYVRDAGDRLAIGALTRHRDVETDALLQEHCPIVSHTAAEIGDPQVRHRGTIGGSVAHGDPASDLPTVLLALDAELAIQGPGGERAVPASEFFTGTFETALGPQDVLREIRVPKLGDASVWSYVKFTRRAQDWATVGVAVVGTRHDGSLADAAVGLTSMGATPLRASGVEQALAGGAAPKEAAEAAADGTSPPSDTNASAEFRAHLARVLTGRAIEEALAR